MAAYDGLIGFMFLPPPNPVAGSATEFAVASTCLCICIKKLDCNFRNKFKQGQRSHDHCPVFWKPIDIVESLDQPEISFVYSSSELYLTQTFLW